MEGKRLYFSKKSCGSTACVNYHSILVEKIEANIIALFDNHALSNRIIPIPVAISEATHMQYIDVNGTAHIHPSGMVVEPISSIVNFRLLIAPERFTCYQPLETPLEPLINIYEKHIKKLCLELRIDILHHVENCDYFIE